MVYVTELPTTYCYEISRLELAHLMVLLTLETAGVVSHWKTLERGQTSGGIC